MELDGVPNGYFTESIEEPSQIEHVKKQGGGGSEISSQHAVSPSGCFDCNICLDFAVDPVVTLCGHLYCWPCIYKWLQIESVSPPQCPVCKASVSQNSLVPLYGRGHTSKHSSRTFDVPQRPNSSFHNREQTETETASLTSGDHRSPLLRHRHQHYHVHQHEHHHHYPYFSPPNEYALSAPSSPTLGSTSRVIQSTAGVLGGMAIAVLPWVFRNHQEAAAATSLQFSNPYYGAGSGGSTRLRRQEMEVENSLHQIWMFFFCCAMLCLLLF